MKRREFIFGGPLLPFAHGRQKIGIPFTGRLDEDIALWYMRNRDAPPEMRLYALQHLASIIEAKYDL